VKPQHGGAIETVPNSVRYTSFIPREYRIIRGIDARCRHDDT